MKQRHRMILAALFSAGFFGLSPLSFVMAASSTQTVTQSVYVTGGSLAVGWVPSTLTAGIYTLTGGSSAPLPLGWSPDANGNIGVNNPANMTALFDPSDHFPSYSYTGSNPLFVQDATGSGAGWHVTMQATPMTEVAPSGGFASGTSALTLPTGSVQLSTFTPFHGQTSTPTYYVEAPSASNNTSVSGADLMDVGQYGLGFNNNPTQYPPAPFNEVMYDPTSSPIQQDSNGNLAPYVMDLTNAPLDDNTPMTVIEADAGTGMGSYAFQGLLHLDLVIPASAYIDPINYPSSPTPYSTTMTVSIVSGP